MAWTAFEHLRASSGVAPDDPAVVGLDRDIAAAWLCGLAAAGLMTKQARGLVALAIVFAVAYLLSARWHLGRLDYDALTYAPVVAAALFVCWPRLIRVKQP